MSTREEMIEKIRKLNAHAKSAEAIGNEEEAQAFAAKVQELLTAYKISMSQVRESQVTEEPIEQIYLNWKDLGLHIRTKRVAWVESLAQIVGDAYYCRFIISMQSRCGNIGFFVGTDTDRKVAQFMFVALGRALYAIAEQQNREYKLELWRRAGSPRPYTEPAEAAGFKSGFILGFLKRLRERFEEEIRPKVGPTAQAQTAAIVLVRKNALDRVNSWVDENLKLKNLSGLRLRSSNRDGYAAGKRAANDLSLKKNPIERTGNRIKELR